MENKKNNRNLDKIIDDTLEKLCVADIAQNYCASCTSGSGCCAKPDSTSLLFDEQALFDAVNQLPKDVELFPQEVRLTSETVHTSTTEYTSYTSSQSKSYYMEEPQIVPRFEGEEQFGNQAFHMAPEEGEIINSDEEENEVVKKPVRRRVTIDLSKEGDLSDAEIIQRLLSSSDSLSSDEPLEIILEIVGDEEDSDCSDGDQTTKTFQSLREKLRSSSFFTSSPKILMSDPNNSEIKTLPRMFEHSTSRDKSESWITDSAQDFQSFNSPSYQKANSLINEIENCFMETANIVEKTLGAVKTSNKLANEKGENKAARDGYSNETIPNNVGSSQRTSNTVKEALNIFDSIMSGNKKEKQDIKNTVKIKRENSVNDITNVNIDEQNDKVAEQFRESLCQHIPYEKQHYQNSLYAPNSYLEGEYGKESYDLNQKSVNFLGNQHDYATTQLNSSEFGHFQLNDNEIRTDDNNYLSNLEENSYYKTSNVKNDSEFKLDDETYHYERNSFLMNEDIKMTEDNKFDKREDVMRYPVDESVVNSQRDNISDNMQQLFWRNWQSGFERDVDELFKDCYELSSTEPNSSVAFCLKNLENLSSQLRDAKENILQEMIYEDNFGKYNSASHSGSQISLENKKKLALINELIEKKLKSKLKIEKFNVGPLLIGLEGRTHKLIAEVSPISGVLENNLPPSKENVNIKSFLMDNENINIKRTFHNDIIENVISQENADLHDSAFDSNSEISMATNSNSFASLSQTESTSYSKMDGTISKNSGVSNLTDDGISSILSHEETLALYEDNQELQQSLLSILHSLNDIHDNFLRRRQKEVDLSQQCSQALHENIKASIADKSYEFIDHDYSNFENNHFSYHKNGIFPPEEFSDQFLRSEAVNDDFEAIEKIIKVSDELKNLWLFGSDDLNTLKRRPKPSRSLSLNRYYRPKKYCRNFSTNNSEDEFSEMEDDEMTLNNEKSYSMPNLNSDSSRFIKPYDYTSTSPSQILQSNDLFVEDFNKRMKYENAKCYEVTLNFLKRIMEACKLLDDDDGQSQTLQETMLKSFTEFSTSQERFHQDHDQQHQSKAYMRTY